MSTPSPPTRHEQSHFVSLVLQSKKALQHGEQLCSRASVVSGASVQCAVQVLALDAKVKWMTDAVLEQFKLAAGVAKTLEQKRSQLRRRVQAWDAERTQRTDNLDGILESLGSQVVPPDFHEEGSSSSLFGSQHSDEPPDRVRLGNGHLSAGQSPTGTVRDPAGQPNARTDRSKWKTLRDFVDERAIEDALDMMEKDRNVVDDILARTDDYPETLSEAIVKIQNSLPHPEVLPPIEDILNAQGAASTTMAGHLESLASHYDQMYVALRDSESGETFHHEDLKNMNRDTEELPSIMSELEDGIKSIERTHEQLESTKSHAREQLELHRHILNDLEELGDIMTEMVEMQQLVDDDCDAQLTEIQGHLYTLQELHHRYVLYQASFNKMLLEIARRKKYIEAAEKIVTAMTAQLNSMTLEEARLRNEFREEHGAHLPQDICLFIENPPTRWEVLPYQQECVESLPEVDEDLVAEATDRIANSEVVVPGSESL